ncbi:zincin-like metallopeptidase domain-containing protein [Helicobacter pylori]
MSGEKKNIRQEIINREVDKLTNFIEEAIKNNNTPWRKEWDTSHAIAHNPYTGSIYQGMNERFLRLNTLIKDYSSNAYLTFNNIKDLGGYVKKGEKAQALFHYSKIPLTEEDIQKKLKEYEKRTGKKPSKEIEESFREEEKVLIKPFSVFNLDQCEVDYEKLKEHQIRKGIIRTLDELKAEKEIKTIEIVESILKNSNILIKENGVGRAFYDSREDFISLPPRKVFKDEKGYYATALHELGHATGHESRLNRKLENFFGSEDYAQEELRAELFSFLQGQNLLLNFDFDNHTSYLKSWQEKAKDGIREAVLDSLKMCDYVEKNWYPKQKQKIIKEQKKELEFKNEKRISPQVRAEQEKAKGRSR